ncbi:kinesin-domain-containing protein [Microthyrium microscopicum]|uniref:Kinesin-like protein n=1 Tax=Microthyrium microscopicum TaxID=703497 RepID=A0A6A6U5B8_9PEZI|nr:kinesin-domain-containing protein [Microthyrium microscopicum]
MPAAQEPDSSANVKVVVRVRQFVQRERDRNAKCIVEMDPKTESTTIFAPRDSSSARARREDKTFTFDKSYWSHDPQDAHYAQQEDIYSSFGEEFLDHNFNGFHTCIFAYGQTGSGKSYTMMGTQDQPGLIPRTCEALFSRIKDEPEPNTTYSVHVSYFEVYNEHVRDLLVMKSNTPYYLKIRESQTEGVYVQGLTDAAVKNFADVERLMKMGDLNRTTASTKMNDTSSRSHAVFTLQLKQIQHSLITDETIERTARFRLVDLAGSERAKSTEATGQRLLEGGKINKSLTTLGRVIAALADPRRQAVGSPGGRNSPRPGTPSRRGRSTPLEIVPYRDSVLTWLLKDSLGGNSKTAMVACISPTDYDETLSTLRYADQAKRIRTRATANIDAVSAAERDAQISLMAETIRALQVSVNNAHARKKEEATEMEDYQKQVDKMQRLMEETRQVSEARIRALSAEVEDLRPENDRLKGEIEALRRHLGLVVNELKNPIVIPEELQPEHERSEIHEDTDEAVDMSVHEDPHEVEKQQWARDMQQEAEDMLKELGFFKRKVHEDKTRFPIIREIQAN